MTVYLAADIHGHIRMEWLIRKLQKTRLTADDHLVILGDAGIVWHPTEHQEVKQFYQSLPCMVLFLDGNHENFDMLGRFPVISLHGGNMHRIGSNIFHMMRGEAYTIEGRSFFVFGGGYSLKRLSGTSPVTVWDEEMPNESEYSKGVETLDGLDHQVDYILTHVAPYEVAKSLGREPVMEERALNDYLERIERSTSYGHWYFGHYHTDMDDGKHTAVYDRIIRLE